MKIRLTIVNRSGRAVPRTFLERWTARLGRELAKRAPGDDLLASRLPVSADLVVAFVTKTEIQKLNRTYRGKNKPTDVLSFEGDPVNGDLGELAISPEVISKQAREHGLLVREELGYMVLHGILHLLAYDHETGERDAKTMFDLQDAIFDRLRKP